MTAQRTIDTHTHILTEETAALLSKEAPKLNIGITRLDDAVARLQAGSTVYPDFPTGGFDIARRLRDMDATGVDVQVLSATPTTYLYGQDAALCTVTSAIQNDQMAKHIADHPTQFMGIATLPMQAPQRAADELKRAMTKLGLRGAMIASNIMGAKSRRSGARAGVGNGRGARRLHVHPSPQCRRDRSVEILLSRQSDR